MEEGHGDLGSRMRGNSHGVSEVGVGGGKREMEDTPVEGQLVVATHAHKDLVQVSPMTI